jgi:hypothetical protein
MSADQLKRVFRDGASASTKPPGISFLSEVTADQYLLVLSKLEAEEKLRKKLEEMNFQLRLALAEAHQCTIHRVRRVASEKFVRN